MRAFLAFCGAVCALISSASVWAQAGGVAPLPRVALIQPEGAPLRPGLPPSLRIQLRGTAEVVETMRPFPPDLPSRLATAAEVAKAERAEWVLWTDPIATDASQPSEHVVLYLVGQRDGRALIEVVRVPVSEGPEVDRSLALKVHELIDVDKTAAYALGNEAVPEAPAAAPAAPSAPAPVSSPPPPAPRVQLWLEAGGQLAFEGDGGAAIDGLIALGPSVALRTLFIALPIELSLGAPRSIEQGGDQAEWSEIGVALWAKLAARVDPLMLGGGLGGKLVLTDVEGAARSGARGQARDLLPALLISADAEWLFTPALGARLALGTELRLKRQYFILEGTDIGNTGRFVPFARLSVVWHAF